MTVTGIITAIVIGAIIGVLAAILVPAMLGYVRKSKITTANTTPSQAQICDGASVEISAMNTPATPA